MQIQLTKKKKCILQKLKIELITNNPTILLLDTPPK